jgi:FkbM family methyltransferase
VGRAPTDAGIQLPHTLPWWCRAERRTALSVAKRLVSPAADRLGQRVPLVRILTARVRRRLDRLRVRVCGAPFRIDVMRRSVSRSVFLGGRWHAPVVEMLRANVRPGMTVADIGANIGFMAVHVGEAVGPEGTVLAFEPEPRNFALLAENARHARWRNVIPIEAAVGETPGTLTLYLSPRDSGDHRTVLGSGDRATTTVPSVAIDDLAARRRTAIHFAKMDIQGAEGQALRGMTKTLRSPDFRGLVLEFWPDALRAAGEDPAAILAQLHVAGLRCASHPAADADAAAFLAAIEPNGSRDLLFLRG